MERPPPPSAVNEMQLMGVGGILLESMKLFREVSGGKIRARDDRTSDEHSVSTSQSMTCEIL